MAKNHDKALLPSLLDRLLDEDPHNQREAPSTRAQILRGIKDAVRRDLEDLLNTRQRHGLLPPELDELNVSLVNYGIPDFTGAAVSGAGDREQLRQVIEQTIICFETRLKSAHVTLVENKDPADRTLRFRIAALLHAEPAPEPVVFDSQLEPTISAFQVEAR